MKQGLLSCRCLCRLNSCFDVILGVSRSSKSIKSEYGLRVLLFLSWHLRQINTTFSHQCPLQLLNRSTVKLFFACLGYDSLSTHLQLGYIQRPSCLVYCCNRKSTVMCLSAQYSPRFLSFDLCTLTDVFSQPRSRYFCFAQDLHAALVFSERDCR